MIQKVSCLPIIIVDYFYPKRQNHDKNGCMSIIL
jgi:hypothetical protein